MDYQKGMAVDSPIGKMELDKTGSPVAVVKMDPEQAYIGVPALLQKFIDYKDLDAWHKIKEKIDYLYANLDRLLIQLDKETHFKKKVKSEVMAGKKLLFKPNLVNPQNIDHLTHGEGLGNSACTEWPYMAALMRWFHDKLDVPYYQMMLGEAASMTSVMAGILTQANDGGRQITTEAVIEGRSGDFYGGWGFYFARKYLTETHPPSHADDPMNGYEESIMGKYLPPGQVTDKLMVYDLNRLYDVAAKQRTIPVPEGVNYQEITLHKVVVGGDRNNPQDIRDYPGCVLINVPRLKIHAIDLLTNAVKNLGIGLYPLEVASADPKDRKWKYAFPYDLAPAMKTEIPHEVWFPSMDPKTGFPLKDKQGEYLVRKTGGIAATQADVISATLKQGVYMLHVVDGIQVVNIDHQGNGMGIKVAEGLALASLNPVALDLCCARYCFKTIPIVEARKLKAQHGLATDFLQKVPIPKPDGKNIVSSEGFDSPLLRYHFFDYFEGRGLGEQKYYVLGWDVLKDAPLASLEGHLGCLEGKRFTELTTGTLYYGRGKMLWDLQRTVLSYFSANDSLTGSAFYKQTMDTFDENKDGVIDYDEMGKKGFLHHYLRIASLGYHFASTEKYGFLRGTFTVNSRIFRNTNPQWNPGGHDFMDQFNTLSAATVAYMMSNMEFEGPDLMIPTMTWGKGKWPSVQFAIFMMGAMTIYGPQFPMQINLVSMYGSAFQYADKTLNGGTFTGSRSLASDPEAANRYLAAVAQGAKPLDFTVYVPMGFGTMAGRKIPNIEETSDARKVFTAQFAGEKEIWS